MSKRPPIDVVHLLPIVDELLIKLLKSLSEEDWHRQTVARLWKVKDVVAHLLDSNVRILSMLRDGYYGEKPGAGEDLLTFLNRLNADWVTAMKRVSPDVLILLHEATGKLYCDYYSSLDPYGISPFAVNWAGESESHNWMHIAREYAEKWLHQQQVRDAVGKPGLMTEALFRPFISIFMLALPYTYRNMQADEGTVVKLIVDSEVGGSWFLLREHAEWQLVDEAAGNIAAEIIIPPDVAWKLFSKSMRYTDVVDRLSVRGDFELARPALDMVSVMA